MVLVNSKLMPGRSQKPCFTPFSLNSWHTPPTPRHWQKWDELLSAGRKIFAVAVPTLMPWIFSKGFFQKTVLPYDFHFSAINNHLLVQNELTGNVDLDSRQIYLALKNGNSFIGYDLPASTRGFTFTLENEDQVAQMGESLHLTRGGTIRIHTPSRADIEIVHNGKVIQYSENVSALIKTVTEKGYYRVQCKINFLGKKRGWIYSNPIFCVA